jgi:NAD(P)-dependent dehydrogenase (short-subunit alcohol dehydrogenase family)
LWIKWWSYEFTRCLNYRALTGIGRATALAFAHEGARVVISGRREEEGNKHLAELRKLGAEAEFVRSDVRHEEDIRSLVDRTVERFGRERPTGSQDSERARHCFA